jgi:hypothetical protein
LPGISINPKAELNEQFSELGKLLSRSAICAVKYREQYCKYWRGEKSNRSSEISSEQTEQYEPEQILL